MWAHHYGKAASACVASPLHPEQHMHSILGLKPLEIVAHKSPPGKGCASVCRLSRLFRGNMPAPIQANTLWTDL